MSGLQIDNIIVYHYVSKYSNTIIRLLILMWWTGWSRSNCKIFVLRKNTDLEPNRNGKIKVISFYSFLCVFFFEVLFIKVKIEVSEKI